MSSHESFQAKSDQVELEQEKAVVSADTHAVKLREEAHTLTARESLSAYFTIAAAAFGLISDGCEWVEAVPAQCLMLLTYLDQNNLMTMSNVSPSNKFPNKIPTNTPR
jgi:hypothetical protein